MVSPAVTSEGEYHPRRAWTAVIVFMILYSLAHLDRYALVLMVDPIRADLGITDLQVSVLQGVAFVLFYTLCGLPIGWAVDRYPRRWIVFVGVCVWSLAAMSCGLARTYWQLLIARAGVGAGEASLHPSVYSTLTDMFPKNRLATAMAVYSMGSAIGAGVALILGGLAVGLAGAAQSYDLPLFGQVKPWQMVFIATGAPGVFIAFLVFLISEPPRRGKLATATPSKAPALHFMRERWRLYLAHFAGFSTIGMMTGAFAAWVPSHLIRSFHWSPQQVGTLLGTQTLVCFTTGALAAGYLTDRWMNKGVKDAHFRFYVWALVALGVAGALAVTTRDARVAVSCITVVKFLTPFLPIAAGALQITAPNQYRGQITVIFLMVFNIVGSGLGPVVAAGISDLIFRSGDIGRGMAVMFATFTPLAMVILTWGMKPLRQAVEAAERWS